jgi:hypothetical protein
MRTNDFYTLTAGDKVRGSYMGVPYAGVITELRAHTMNHRITLFTIDLDQPITVFGSERDSIHFGASHDHAAGVHYNGGIDLDPTPIERAA